MIIIDNYTLSQFHTLVTSTSYDLSENIYTYNLSDSYMGTVFSKTQ